MLCFAAQDTSGKLAELKLEHENELLSDEMEATVLACGLCMSDVSMAKNKWKLSSYPMVPGHEVVGRVERVGEGVTNLEVGDVVGVGWHSRYCMSCEQCVSGSHNLCGKREPTMVKRYGGLAETIRCQAAACVKVPDGMDCRKVAPLLCGGLTVFNTLMEQKVRPTDTVGIIGLGALGLLALQFCRAWGCKVVLFTARMTKEAEVRKLGAHEVVDTSDTAEIAKHAGTLDALLSTTNDDLPWAAYMATLAPEGKFHFVGVKSEKVSFMTPQLLLGQLAVTGTPVGGPESMRKMLEFCDRHKIEPKIQEFKMTQCNEVFAELESGAAKYRAVLTP